MWLGFFVSPEVGGPCLLDATMPARDVKGDIFLSTITGGFTGGGKKSSANGWYHVE